MRLRLVSRPNRAITSQRERFGLAKANSRPGDRHRFVNFRCARGRLRVTCQVEPADPRDGWLGEQCDSLLLGELRINFDPGHRHVKDQTSR